MREIKRKIVILGSVVLMIILVQPLSLAKKLTIEDSGASAIISMDVLVRSGTIKITQPSGKILIIEPGQSLPDIFLGSKVEVVSGKLIFLTDNVNITIEAGGGIIFSRGPISGENLFTVTTGYIEIITAEGKKIIVGPGYSYYTNTNKIVAPPREDHYYEPEPKLEASPYTP